MGPGMHNSSSPSLSRFLFTFAISTLGAFLCTFFLAAFAAMFLCSCAFAGEPPGPLLDEEALPDGAAGAALPPRELEARLEGIGLRVSPIVQLERRDGAVVWRVEGRASVELSAVASWVPDDAYGRAELTGPRSFSITFRDASEQNTMASGLPLFLSVTPRQGAPAEAAIWFRPRVERAVGSGRIFPHATIQPVWVAEESEGELHGAVEYRGKVTTPSDWSLESGESGDSAPRLTSLGGGKWRLGWSFDALAATLRSQPPRFSLRARRGEVVVTRMAELEIRAVRLAITRADPRQVWPSDCEPAVRACLAALPTPLSDTEPCGTYRQVLACGGPTGACD